jgi:catechol 2,3-dioxygenase-like lactoylglutathione lyase family enzyme
VTRCRRVRSWPSTKPWDPLRYGCAVITGAHAVVFTREPERLRAFLQDALGFGSVDAGGGWLIFELPPAELAAHPSDGDSHHELYLMCDDIEATVAELTAKGVEFTEPVTDQRFGLVTRFKIAEGETLAIYQPKHATAVSTK